MWTSIKTIRMLSKVIISSILFSLATSAANVALYWGQGNYGSLASTCESEDAEIIILSFLYEFGKGTNSLDFSGICSTTFEDGLLHCPSIANDIKTCQSKGKKVLLSLGGASGAYGFDSDEAGEEFGTTLWNMFGNGDKSTERPFDDAILDGFDFDIEANSQTGYASCANKLKQYYNADSSKNYYISAAPQCPYPDASVGDLMSNSHIDFAFIQFYNNYCSTLGSNFNWDTWVKYANEVSPNKDVKLYLGLPGSPSAAGSGYATPDQVKSTVNDILNADGSNHFGGIMLWDAYWSNLNQINGKSFSNNMQDILNQLGDDQSSAPETTNAALTSTTQPTIIEQPPTTEQPTTTEQPDTTEQPTITEQPITTEEPVTTEQTTTSSTLDIQPTTSSVSDSVTLDIQTTQGKGVDTTVFTDNTQPTTMETVTTSSTSSATTPVTEPTSAPTSGSKDCSSLTGLARAQCMNSNFNAGLYLGSADSCPNEGALACSANGEFAICNFGKWVIMPCSSGTSCFAYNFGDQVDVGCDYSSNKSKFEKRDGGLLNLIKRNVIGHVHHAH